MFMLLCMVSLGLYSIFANETYPKSWFLLLKEADAVPDFSKCTCDTGIRCSNQQTPLHKKLEMILLQ